MIIADGAPKEEQSQLALAMDAVSRAEGRANLALNKMDAAYGEIRQAFGMLEELREVMLRAAEAEERRGNYVESVRAAAYSEGYELGYEEAKRSISNAVLKAVEKVMGVSRD